jgi:hypothetical protein
MNILIDKYNYSDLFKNYDNKTIKTLRIRNINKKIDLRKFKNCVIKNLIIENCKKISDLSNIKITNKLELINIEFVNFNLDTQHILNLNFINIKNITFENNKLKYCNQIVLSESKIDNLCCFPSFDQLFSYHCKFKNLRNLSEHNIDYIYILDNDELENIDELKNVNKLILEDCKTIESINFGKNINSVHLSNLPNLKNIDITNLNKDCNIILNRLKKIKEIVFPNKINELSISSLPQFNFEWLSNITINELTISYIPLTNIEKVISKLKINILSIYFILDNDYKKLNFFLLIKNLKKIKHNDMKQEIKDLSDFFKMIKFFNIDERKKLFNIN